MYLFSIKYESQWKNNQTTIYYNWMFLFYLASEHHVGHCKPIIIKHLWIRSLSALLHVWWWWCWAQLSSCLTWLSSIIIGPTCPSRQPYVRLKYTGNRVSGITAEKWFHIVSKNVRSVSDYIDYPCPQPLQRWPPYLLEEPILTPVIVVHDLFHSKVNKSVCALILPWCDQQCADSAGTPNLRSPVG